jgi:hypothetical protein
LKEPEKTSLLCPQLEIMMNAAIKQLAIAQKRAEHFAGPYEDCRLGWGDWAALIPMGRYTFVENHLLMLPMAQECEGGCRRERLRGWNYFSQLAWLASLAEAINRYIDQNRVKDDAYFILVLRWFQQESFADWRVLASSPG